MPGQAHDRVKQEMVNGVDGSNDEDDVMSPLHHQNDGDGSSDREDNDVDKEYSEPNVSQTSLRRGPRVRKQVKHLVPTHKGQSYDQGVAFHQVSHLRVSEEEEIKGQFAGAGYSTKKGVIHFNFNEDTQCTTAMTEEQSDAQIVGVILAQQYSLKNGAQAIR